jgi:hypothetical protein
VRLREGREHCGRVLRHVKAVIVVPHGEGGLLPLKWRLLLLLPPPVIDVVRRYHSRILVAQYLLGLFQAGSLKLGFHVGCQVGVFLVFDQLGDGLEVIFIMSL